MIPCSPLYLIIEISLSPGRCCEEGWVCSQVATGQVTKLIQPNYHAIQFSMYVCIWYKYLVRDDNDEHWNSVCYINSVTPLNVWYSARINTYNLPSVSLNTPVIISILHVQCMYITHQAGTGDGQAGIYSKVSLVNICIIMYTPHSVFYSLETGSGHIHRCIIQWGCPYQSGVPEHQELVRVGAE